MEPFASAATQAFLNAIDNTRVDRVVAFAPAQVFLHERTHLGLIREGRRNRRN